MHVQVSEALIAFSACTVWARLIQGILELSLMDLLRFEPDSSNAMCWLPNSLRQNAETRAVAKLQFPEWGMSEHRGFASLLWSHSLCFTHTPWHCTAVTPFLAFKESSAVEALSRGLHKLGLCFYPGENSRSLCFNLAADCCGGSASTAAVQGTLEQGSQLTLPAAMVLVSVGWAVNCVFPAGTICVPSAAASSSSTWVSVHQLSSFSWVLAGCPPAPSPPTSTLAHFFSQLSQYFPFFTLCSFFHHSCTYCASAWWFTSSWPPLTAFLKNAVVFLLGSRVKPFLSYFYYLFLSPGCFSCIEAFYF